MTHGDVRVEDDGYLWVMRGEVDAAVQSRLEDDLKQVARSAERPIVIDLSKVTFMDSGGLRLLYHAVEGSPEPPLLRGVPGRTLDLLELSGVISLFRIEQQGAGSASTAQAAR
ncbi:anti-sigma B factor antagonist [Isoptericola sp. CG 20/1183]|uniref:Anti-sigma B factor antagonist n=1 Tax=Isoptericola halotolerans TaxID=300560 RepID=A0ABX5EIR3_9MICO|nr:MULTISPECIES: STAS domain-containing protein [Isoptericola]PRZ09574.1 anti-sigma B factor antagonist [Isoptericola sp. CG 20/1183]PRZ10375.1 anti-sigma B factor antagonist [Isoptericola halotolerans]